MRSCVQPEAGRWQTLSKCKHYSQLLTPRGHGHAGRLLTDGRTQGHSGRGRDGSCIHLFLFLLHLSVTLGPSLEFWVAGSDDLGGGFLGAIFLIFFFIF